MANNSVALGRNDGPDFFADDDPLAELARIAGYDERPSRSVQPAEQPRREPVFNLEDELLREFERYDAPRPDPVEDIALEAEVPAFPAPSAPIEPHPSILLRERFAEADPFADPEPASAAPAQQGLAAFEQAPVRQEAPFSVQSDFSAAQPAAEHRTLVEPSFDANAFDLDLVSELETSLAPAAPVTSRPSSRPPARAYEPGFRMPLANFNRAAEPMREPRSAAAHPVERVVAVEPVVEVPSLAPSAWEEEVHIETPPAEEKFSALEEPVYDVDHYSRSSHSAASAPSVFEGPVFEEPVSIKAIPVPPVAVVAEPPVVHADPVPVKAHVEPAAPPVPDGFVLDEDFEIALDELELDLSDLMADEPAPVVAAPIVAAAAPEPVVPRPAEPRAVEQKPAMSAAAATVAPAVPAFLANSRGAAAAARIEARASAAPAIPQPIPEEVMFDDADLFDPALLSETEDMPEAVPEMHVPELPVHEPEKPAAAHSDYDLDLDAELASFLETTNAEARVQEAALAKSAAQPAFSAGLSARRPANPSPSDGLDEFERALEEDFRRSLSAPIPGRTRLEEDDDSFETYEEPVARRPVSTFVLPLSIAGFLLIAGVSGYAWFAGDSGNLAGDGAPVVIAADTDPVKMVPENPGGKTVPNQDKAVYDRVAGGALSDPKQSSLISSDEQPVDVVQKTLVPEGLPLEGENDEMPSAVTEEARLAPGEQSAAAASGPQDQLSVMPRKVKTMIVRADGTLVEQISEVPATAPATSVRSAKVPAAPALAEPTQTASTANPMAPVSAPSATTDLSAVNVAKTTAVTAAGAPASSPAAPIPTARPAEQPVKVVASVSDQGNVRPAAIPTAAATAPVATASVPAAPSATAGAGGYYMQVASLPSEADAQKSYRNLSAKFGNVIGGRGVDIAKAEIAGKGTFYRVRIPAGSKDEAVALCERFRSAGGSCLIAR
jgi:SPOR domain